MVTHERRIPEGLEYLRAGLERTQAVARRLIGLNLPDANELATRSGCHLRVVRRDGKGLVVTANLDLKRINIGTEGDIVVEASSG